MFGFSSKSDSKKIFEQMEDGGKIPILTEYKPFKDMVKYVANETMRSLMLEIEEISRQEKDIILNIKNSQKEKSRFAARVLYVSDQLNIQKNPNAQDSLDNLKGDMSILNQVIEQGQSDLRILELQKETLNKKLLKETLDYCYDNINNDEDELGKLLPEIDKLRQELEEKRIRRDDLQNKIEYTYGFIHGLMGAKKTEKMDEEMLI